jgi:peptide/nickel transport system permease protein
MITYIRKRVMHALFVIWAAYTVSFILLWLLPGNPVSAMLGQGSGQGSSADPAQIAQLEAEYGLNKPVPIQYLTLLWKALHGNFGHSMETGQAVTSAIAEVLPQTAELTVAALIIALVFGAVIALVSTYTRFGVLRQFLLTLPSLGVSIPTFWSGLLLIQLFSFHWHYFPSAGNNGLSSLVLPAITLGLPAAAAAAQVLAKSMDNAWRQPFVSTLNTKGVPPLRIHVRHIIRHAIIPSLTILGVTVGSLLSGAVVVETIFSRVGIGRLIDSAVTTQDIPVVQALVLLSAVVFVVINLLVDMLYPLIDPRIAHSVAVSA